MRLRIDTEIRKLDLLYGNISAISDDELKAHLAKYFCVKISGFLENVVKARVEKISVGTSPKAVSNYLQEDVKRLTNLSDDKLLRLLRKFNPDWEADFLDKVLPQDKTQETNLSIHPNRQQQIESELCKKYNI